MPFAIRSYRQVPVCCPITFQTWDFEGHGRVWNLSLNGLRLSGDLPMKPGETLSLKVTQPNAHRIAILEAVVRWSRGQEFTMENSSVEPHTHSRLQHYVKSSVQEPVEMNRWTLRQQLQNEA